MKRISSTPKHIPNKTFAFGDLVVAVYSASNKRKARALLRFLVNADIVVFPGSPQLVIC